MSVIIILLETFRWWGIIAGILCVYDGIYGLNRLNNPTIIKLPSWSMKMNHLGTMLIGGTLLIGGSIGVALSKNLISFYSLEYVIAYVLLWAFASSAGWVSTFKYTKKPKLMYSVAWLAFIATLSATILSKI